MPKGREVRIEVWMDGWVFLLARQPFPFNGFISYHAAILNNVPTLAHQRNWHFFIGILLALHRNAQAPNPDPKNFQYRLEPNPVPKIFPKIQTMDGWLFYKKLYIQRAEEHTSTGYNIWLIRVKTVLSHALFAPRSFTHRLNFSLLLPKRLLLYCR